MTRKDLTRLVKDFVVPVHTVIHVDDTVDEALVTLRSQKIDEKIIYFYVVDKHDRLQGVVSTRNLLLSSPRTHISEIMEKSLIFLMAEQTLEQAMEVLSSHRLLALPVVEKDKRFLGVVDIGLYMEEAVDIAKERHRNDVFQMLGLTIEEGKKKSTWKSYCTRMPWIFCNMAGGIGCAIISRIFEMVLAKVLLLAMFIPLVLSLSESISMQSMTQSLQLLHKQKLSFKAIFKRVTSESKMTILLSTTCGVLVGLISLLWGQGVAPGLTIAVGLTISIALSASVGSSIPLFLHARQLDPKVAAGPVVLMFADIITTSLYLSLATWWLL